MDKYKKMQNNAEKAMRKAVAEVVISHKRSGRPLAVWENGKVAYISADKAGTHKRNHAAGHK